MTVRGDRLYLWEGPPRLELLRRSWIRSDGSPAASHALITQDGIPGVVVVALRVDRLLLVEHERPWAGETLLELPRGFGEVADGVPGTDAACCSAAARELLEETGYRGVDPKVLGRYHPTRRCYPRRSRWSGYSWVPTRPRVLLTARSSVPYGCRCRTSPLTCATDGSETVTPSPPSRCWGRTTWAESAPSCSPGARR